MEDDGTKIFRVLIPGLIIGWVALGVLLLRHEQPRTGPELYRSRVSREPLPTVVVEPPLTVPEKRAPASKP